MSLAPLFAFSFIALGRSLVRLQIGLYTGIGLLIVMALTQASLAARCCGRLPPSSLSRLCLRRRC